MRSEFEKLLKQHKDALTDELVKLGKHRQVQLAEWDIERNETDYEFYFDGAWNAQQAKIDELQKRVDAAFRVLSQLNDLDDEAHKRWKREACMFSQGESNAYEHSVRLIEQALRGNN